MRTYRFVTLDVFTDRRFGGNQLAVFPEAQGLSDDEMQALASEFNLSETTFVLPPQDPANTARVRIFNRTAEMPFAGHPNVGTPPVPSFRPPSPPRSRCGSARPCRPVPSPPAPASRRRASSPPATRRHWPPMAAIPACCSR
jgi:hypothetical protein